MIYFCVLGRAVEDTWFFWGRQPLRYLIHVIFSFGVGTYFHYKAHGWEAIVAEWEVWISYTGWAGLAFIAIIFAWNLLAAPVRIDREQQEKYRDLSVVHDQLLEAQKPKLDVSFDSNDLQCLYVHQGRGTQFRIKVNNNGGEHLRQVLVRVVSLTTSGPPLPAHTQQIAGALLRIRHQTKQAVQDLSPGTSDYWSE